MIKVTFERLENEPITNTMYDDDYIPFSITIGTYPSLPSTIYGRNLSGENFIEFRFDRENCNLYEISLVAIQNNTIEDISLLEIDFKRNEYYDCLIDEASSELDNSDPIKILRNESSIIVNWCKEDHINMQYFALSSKCSVGINSSSYLTSVMLTGLTKKDIDNILG